MKWSESKMLWIDLSSHLMEAKPIDLEIASEFVGGRGYATRLLYDGLSEGTPPLSPENMIIVMTGPLTGLAPTGGRCSITGRSPLTNTICSCSVGGRLGTELRRAGYAGTVIKGRSEEKLYLSIKNGVELKDARELWGIDTKATSAELRKREGDCSTAIIGQAGENLVPYANIVVDEHRTAGRGGLGAVLGSKNLKGIAVSGKAKIEPVNEFSFNSAYKECLNVLKGNPVTGDALNRFGTLVLLDPVNKHGIFPVKNFREGMSKKAGRQEKGTD